MTNLVLWPLPSNGKLSGSSKIRSGHTCIRLLCLFKWKYKVLSGLEKRFFPCWLCSLEFSQREYSVLSLHVYVFSISILLDLILLVTDLLICTRALLRLLVMQKYLKNILRSWSRERWRTWIHVVVNIYNHAHTTYCSLGYLCNNNC